MLDGPPAPAGITQTDALRVREFSSGAPADDDRTLLVLKRVAPSRV
jgi:serine phosphatase RsbU (regulator of sigma subunit)